MKIIATFKVTLQSGEHFIVEQIQNDEGLVAVHLPKVDSFGYGATLEDAISDAVNTANAGL